MSRLLNDPLWKLPPVNKFSMPRGLPRPLYCGLPAPYTAVVTVDLDGPGRSKPLFSLASSQRFAECRSMGLCILCGERMGTEATVIWDDQLGGVIDDWMHDRCAHLSQAHCPHLREKKEHCHLISDSLTELALLPRVIGDASCCIAAPLPPQSFAPAVPLPSASA